MVQLKQLAIELALQYQVLEVTSERMALERDNHALESDMMLARDHSARHAAEQEIKVRLLLGYLVLKLFVSLITNRFLCDNYYLFACKIAARLPTCAAPRIHL